MKPCMKILKVPLILITILFCLSSHAAETGLLFCEEFKDLSNWEPLYFPKIKKHSSYAVISEEGRSYLRAVSDASASAIIYRKTFNVYDYPRIRWRWKVDSVYTKAKGREKTGDDYPIRIYVMFQYDPQKAGFSERLMYAASKALYGKYPPHSSLNYVWASRENEAGIITSPYTDRSRMIVLEKGRNKVGQWIDEKVDVLEDYRKAFGKSPPAIAGIAVMNDSDNTKERSVSYVEFIEVFK
ncbi:MAG: hypothetical protein A4E66_01562 [Syntrophus sp. PtaB.Bin001]|jgi:hypothetical protein|nr:MAG: hypothetical protein A4E66_01562 [Syntrophus sp. PtaB.Bin001]